MASVFLSVSLQNRKNGKTPQKTTGVFAQKDEPPKCFALHTLGSVRGEGRSHQQELPAAEALGHGPLSGFGPRLENLGFSLQVTNNGSVLRVSVYRQQAVWILEHNSPCPLEEFPFPSCPLKRAGHTSLHQSHLSMVFALLERISTGSGFQGGPAPMFL